ncbi:alpha-methylacyl-CoA racemase [Kordiimonas sediminis]|uniref:Alpha-methylacyl-CoA racemase n=1 Tax=Kordiimonas sediminis TaxID=1735581 RepID=A0A919AN84_9PROT|nr:CaiB/BaiF CoA-transferase family protein [Kordiimonas sediminis]GHF17363.1 alpha-methylacyl-CoA racemase [Kordiimonas sediminis]
MGPLSGVRIVEFAGLGPGPFCGMMLADMGADVIRIDRPVDIAGKSGRVDAFSLGKHDILARNRKTVRLDIRDDANKSAIIDLIKGADALIEGFRPGVMERLGFGPEAILAENPALVYGRMTGWGQTGPLAHLAGHDANYISVNGVLDTIGNKGEKPAIPPTLVGDMGGGAMFLAFGILAGILHARSTGEGQVVDAAIVDGSAVLSSIVWAFKGTLGWGPHGTNLVDGGPHFYDTYACLDGKYISVGAIEPQFYAIVMDKLGLTDDPDFKVQMNPGAWQQQKAKLAEIFKNQPQAHWAELFADTDGCVWPVLTPDEALEHPHIAERETYITKDGVTQPAPAPRFSKTPAQVRSLAGEGETDIEAVLKSWENK